MGIYVLLIIWAICITVSNLLTSILLWCSISPEPDQVLSKKKKKKIRRITGSKKKERKKETKKKNKE